MRGFYSLSNPLMDDRPSTHCLFPSQQAIQYTLFIIIVLILVALLVDLHLHISLVVVVHIRGRQFLDGYGTRARAYEERTAGAA